MTDESVPAQPQEEPLPVSVLTGFLGSGKTTLLRHLLAQPAMDRTAVIINEFGEIGLDHMLVERAEEDMILMNSGCLCCTVRGDLVETMRRLYGRRLAGEVPPFERLVIETTGLADPAPILHTLMGDPVLIERFRLDGVIVTVDAEAGGLSLDRHPEAVKQAAMADRLLLTKRDLVETPDAEALTIRLKDLNPAAPVIEARYGEVGPDRLFGAGLYNPATKSLDVQRWLKEEAFLDEHHHHDHGHDHGHHHGHDHGHGGAHGHDHDALDRNRHDDRISAFCVRYDKPLDWDRLNSWVEMMITFYGSQILRLKGILNIAQFENPVVVHGVQHRFHPPVWLDDWPDSDHSSRLVLITRDLAREVIEDTLKSFIEGPPHGR